MAVKYSTTEIEIPVVAAQHPVEHLELPPKFEKPKRIHPRRVLPPVRPGRPRAFHSMTPELALFHSEPALTDSNIALVTNTELAAPGKQGTADSVGEPSVAIHDQVVLYTGNWYAAISGDAGKTFAFINPAAAFKQFDPPNCSFCCDQVVNYIPAIDTFVWLLQYGPDTGDNIQRLAFATSANVLAKRWTLFDITAEAIGAKGAFMDFPDLAVGDNCLYVTTNVFEGKRVGSAVIRIPFSGITGGNIVARPFLDFDFNSFRVTQNCKSTAYFVSHETTSSLAVFSWPESDDAPTKTSVGVTNWNGEGAVYTSDVPDGRTWLDRSDPRHTGATLAGHEAWFAWGVDKGSNGRPHAFVQIARIDTTDMTLIENINIFDNQAATAYGALATNSENEVAISYMLGGGQKFPTHMVGILTGTRKNIEIATGQRGPLDPKEGKGEWGDYLTVRRVYPQEKLFAATGYTMNGAGDGSNRDVTPRFVVFGRASAVTGGNVPAAPTVTPPGVKPPTVAPPTVAPPTVEPGKPFTDVNTLPVVNAALTRKILNAALQAGGAEPQDLEGPPLKFVNPELVTKPGVERWDVKTGRDVDVAKVGTLVVSPGGLGIVPVTVEELIRIPRPADMLPVTKDIPAYEKRRRGPVEFTVWQITAYIILVKLEADGDYHIEVQGPSGDTMVVEVPTPTAAFIGTCPWFANIKAARNAIDQKFGHLLQSNNFTMLDGMLVPRDSVSIQTRELPPTVPQSLTTLPEDSGLTLPTFQTAVPSTRARITGVGFFDKVHGQTGVATLNGIELHPVLKIEFV